MSLDRFQQDVRARDGAYVDAGLQPPDAVEIEVRPEGSTSGVTVLLSATAPVPSPSWTMHGDASRSALLKRLWAG